MCTAMLNENTCRIIYKNTCISGKTLSRKYVYIILSKMLSEIGVYSIIPTFSISSDFHTYWVLISHFYSQHGVFCSKNRTDLLWNYFPDTTFNIVKISVAKQL